MTRLRSEGGFTLPELLISIVILGVISAAVAMAIIVGLANDQKTQDRLEESHDAQLVSIYLPSDLQSAKTVTTTSTTTCSGASNLLLLEWDERTVTSDPATQTDYKVAYRIVSAGGEWQLIRYYCAGSATAEQLVVAHKLMPSCASPDCVASVSGNRVTAKLTSCALINPTTCSPGSEFTFSVTGTRRA